MVNALRRKLTVFEMNQLKNNDVRFVEEETEQVEKASQVTK